MIELYNGGDYMNILFENSYIRNKDLAKELYGYIFFRRNYLFVAYIVLLVSFIINLILLITTGSANWFVFVFVPFFLLLRLFTYFQSIKLMVKRDSELSGGPVEVKTIVTEEFIQHTNSTGGVNKLEYDKIKKCNQTKNLILLQSDAKLIYVFRKDAFSIGSCDAFVEFLRSKGIKVK